MQLFAEKLQATFEWLSTERLVRLERATVLEPSAFIAEMTERGSDVAQGRERHSEIAPMPLR